MSRTVKFVVVILIVHLVKLSAARSHAPRMRFTEGDIAFRKVHLPEKHKQVNLQLGGEQYDIVIAAGPKLYAVDFQSLQVHPKTVLSDKPCGDAAPEPCFNITVLHKRSKADQLLLCRTSAAGTTCCNMNISAQQSPCTRSEHLNTITYRLQEGEPSVLMESLGPDELFTTQSRTDKHVGIYRFGNMLMRPATRDKEQQYLGLVHSRRTDAPLQDKLYAFYKERNTALSLDGDTWLPFVAQVCTKDKGGPKNLFQMQWTSQFNARLFCGDRSSRQRFSELLDVAALHAERWQDTKVYALFKNEWAMTAVCVYTIQDIENVFSTSPFKGYDGTIPKPRPGTCMDDSTLLTREVLEVMDKHPEMSDSVLPLAAGGPVLVSPHHYTRICPDEVRVEGGEPRVVLLLSLENGRVHKVLQNDSQAFLMAEYHPFNHSTHILSMTLHSYARRLYVSSGRELVQVDLQSCGHYGARCQDCVLARDPYCGWNGTHCAPATPETRQDVARGNHSVCRSEQQNDTRRGVVLFSVARVSPAEDASGAASGPSRSGHFLRCPVSSYHAAYAWRHHGNRTACDPTERQCLLLIDDPGPRDEGTYHCESEELGFRRTLVEYQLRLLRAAAAPGLGPLAWVCPVVLVLKALLG